LDEPRDGQNSVPHGSRVPAYIPFVNATQKRKELPMTAHLLILYPIPKDKAKFDRAYREEHLPYAGPKLIGATGVVTKRVAGPAFAPPPYHLMSDVGFPTLDALKACAASESGKEALAHAASISSGGAPMLMVVADDA
jgi:uncharacterized protein (TIGR02118 family)